MHTAGSFGASSSRVSIGQSVGDAQPVLDKILNSCSRLITSNYLFVNLVGDDGRLHLAATLVVGREDRPGWAQVELEVINQAVAKVYPIAMENTATAVAIASGRVLNFADVLHGDDVPMGARASAQAVGKNYSQMTAPLMHGGRGVGSIAVLREALGGFTAKEQALLKSFADQAVIAIQNATLFRETQAALEQQRVSGEVLKVISHSVADAQPVFQAIVQACQRLFVGQYVVLSRVRADGQVEHAAVASAGVTKGRLREFLDRGFPRPLSQSYQAYPIKKQRVVHYPDMLNGPGLPESMRQMARDAGNYTKLIAPLLWNGQGIGTIHITRQPPVPTTAKDTELLKSFAEQAVIAIQNERLFNDTKEALERQTATAEILSVIAASPSNVQPVFEAIVASSKRLVQGQSAAVLLVREGQLHLAAFTPVSAEADHALQANFPFPVAAHPHAASMGAGEVVHIGDTKVEWADAPQMRDMARERGFRSLLTTPLMRRKRRWSSRPPPPRCCRSSAVRWPMPSRCLTRSCKAAAGCSTARRRR